MASATAIVNSPVVFQCFTSASLMLVCASAGIASASSPSNVLFTIPPRDIIVGEYAPRRAPPGEKVGPNRPLPQRSGTLPVASRTADRYFELKSQIHSKLIGV